jgi:hypothetical protein
MRAYHGWLKPRMLGVPQHLWEPVATALSQVPDDQKVGMLAAFEAAAKRTSDLEMLRAVKAYRQHQEELREAAQKRANP